MKRTILVTGGSRGIGKAIVELLRTNSSIEVAAPTRRELDLLSPKSISGFLSGAPDFDGLVNTAGINILGKLEALDDKTIASMYNTNLLAPLKLIQGLVPGMRRRGGGRIVNFSSIWGIRSKELRTLYSMTKFGITGVTRALARELGPDHILINTVAPGYVLTEMTKKNVSPQERTRLCEEIPLRRMADPIEIARVVAFLLSEENTYITGQNITIDGGFLA